VVVDPRLLAEEELGRDEHALEADAEGVAVRPPRVELGLDEGDEGIDGRRGAPEGARQQPEEGRAGVVEGRAREERAARRRPRLEGPLDLDVADDEAVARRVVVAAGDVEGLALKAVDSNFGLGALE